MSGGITSGAVVSGAAGGAGSSAVSAPEVLLQVRVDHGVHRVVAEPVVHAQAADLDEDVRGLAHDAPAHGVPAHDALLAGSGSTGVRPS